MVVPAACDHLRRRFHGKKGDESGRWLRTHLVARGDRAIAPTISAIQAHSPWVRMYGSLPSVLSDLGPEAHDALVAAIQETDDRKERTMLVYALQEGFGDFRFFEQWLATVPRDGYASRETRHFLALMKTVFPDAPLNLRADAIDSEYVAWWQAYAANHPLQ